MKNSCFLAIERHDPGDPCAVDEILNPVDVFMRYIGFKTREEAIEAMKARMPKRKLWKAKDRKDSFYHKWVTSDGKMAHIRTYYDIVIIVMEGE